MNMTDQAQIDHVMTLLKSCIPIFTVLADENRHLILKLLFENGELNVNQITEQLHLSRPAISHHLKIMLRANAVSVKQIGKERFYSVAMSDEVHKLGELVAVLGEYCPNKQT